MNQLDHGQVNVLNDDDISQRNTGSVTSGKYMAEKPYGFTVKIEDAE